MSKEDLMKERFKVIADYPNSIYAVGEVIQQTGQEFFNTAFFEKYPHLFKKLFWWEEREEKDLPKYIIFKDGSVRETMDYWGKNPPFSPHFLTVMKALPYIKSKQL